MINYNINKELQNYINDPKDPLYNFNLGKAYEDNGLNASAISFYLRCAEFSYYIDPLLAYESYLHVCICIDKIGRRVHQLKGMMLRAISFMPDRPEAYYLLCKLYESHKDWHECYALASIGESLLNDNHSALRYDIGYPGNYVFTFEKAVSGWWIGLYDQSIGLLRKLGNNPVVADIYKTAIRNNLAQYGRSYKRPTKYDGSLYDKLRYKFNGAELVKDNYSQCYQDMFVLTMNNGKKNGSFIEIGCDDGFFNSNTALLETVFGWKGISIDISEEKIKKFKTQRSSQTIAMDALKIDFKTLLTQDRYDYLQVDCEPANTSFRILQKIPLDRVKFGVITFEHDNYCDEDKSIKIKSRKYLESFGYIMVVNNISEDRYSDFEDWYVHPDLISKDIIDRMMCISDNVKKVDDYMLNRL